MKCQKRCPKFEDEPSPIINSLGKKWMFKDLPLFKLRIRGVKNQIPYSFDLVN